MMIIIISLMKQETLLGLKNALKKDGYSLLKMSLFPSQYPGKIPSLILSLSYILYLFSRLALTYLSPLLSSLIDTEVVKELEYIDHIMSKPTEEMVELMKDR